MSDLTLPNAWPGLMEQGTDSWFTARLGKVTASRVADLMAKTKADGFTNAAMEWGTEQEPFARAAYEAKTGEMVEEVGFVPHPLIEWAGASPDGLVGLFGLVEIKCPNTATMIDTLLTGKVPSKYNTQMQFQMACTERDWCDYVVFDPRMPAKAQLFIKRVERDNVFIKEMEAEIVNFLAEVNVQIQQLNAIIEG